MDETYTPTEIQGSIRGDFRQVLHWTLSGSPSRVIKIQILAIFLVLLGIFAFMFLALRIGKFELSIFAGSFTFSVQEIEKIGLGLAAYPATIIMHELVHGLTMCMFGARPQYGLLLKHLLFYATAPGYGFRRNAYIIIAIAPLIVLSILAILGMFILQGTIWVPLLAVCAALNVGGAAGDLWITSLILRYSKTAYIVDERDGFRVLIRKD